MRRRADSYVNATQILKVAGVDKGRRTKILEKEILPGTHEIVQGRITAIASDMWRQEGVRSFYKGITPRVLRVAPGQAIVFAVYERVRKIMEAMQPRNDDSDYYSE